MNKTQLEYFLEVAETQHLSNAADNLHISEPALSKSISRLESELHANLFDRTGRGITLSSSGRKFFVYALSAINTLNDGILALETSNSITVQSISLAIFPNLLEELFTTIPNIKIIASNEPTSKLSENLILGLTDLCITPRKLTLNQLSHKLLREDPLYLVIPHDHPFSNRDHLTVSEIMDESYIVGDKYSGTYTHYQSVFEGLVQKPKISVTISNFSEVALYINSGKGVALSLKTALDNMRVTSHFEFLAIPVCDDSNEPYMRPYYMYWRKKNNPANLARVRSLVYKNFNS